MTTNNKISGSYKILRFLPAYGSTSAYKPTDPPLG